MTQRSVKRQNIDAMSYCTKTNLAVLETERCPVSHSPDPTVNQRWDGQATTVRESSNMRPLIGNVMPFGNASGGMP